jgi:hypothetical protein
MPEREPETDAIERQRAEQLDRQITAVLSGRPSAATDREVLWLAAALRPDPPASLQRRVGAVVAALPTRSWRVLQLLAAGLAAVLAAQGLGNVIWGDWVAASLGEASSPHAFVEGGLALLAVAVAVGAGVFRREWMAASVAAGGPLGVVLGVRGIAEVGEFTGGAVLHLAEGFLGAALLVAWWRYRRYGHGVRGEERA